MHVYIYIYVVVRLNIYTHTEREREKTKKNNIYIYTYIYNIPIYLIIAVFVAKSYIFSGAQDGHVVTWGSPGCGGDSGAVSARLRSVCAVRASCGAFAALRTDGSVVCWGSDLEATNVQDGEGRLGVGETLRYLFL
jgi:hypothetical protein